MSSCGWTISGLALRKRGGNHALCSGHIAAAVLRGAASAALIACSAYGLMRAVQCIQELYLRPVEINCLEGWQTRSQRASPMACRFQNNHQAADAWAVTANPFILSASGFMSYMVYGARCCDCYCVRSSTGMRAAQLYTHVVASKVFEPIRQAFLLASHALSPWQSNGLSKRHVSFQSPGYCRRRL